LTEQPSFWRPRAVLSALVVLCFVGLRIWFDVTVPPMGDEAYYWIWGQHLAWSYFDHPPLDAWLQAGIAAIFGWSPFSLRLLTWVSFAGTIAVLWAWARRLKPAEGTSYFVWRTLAVLLAMPVIALFTMPAFHDHLLVFFVIASIFCFWTFAADWSAFRSGAHWIYLAGLTLGLATLSKYNGALLGVGFVLAFAIRPRLWSSLRTPHPYLALLLAIALQAPVIFWNLTEGLASVHYHFDERPSHWGTISVQQLRDFAIWAAVGVGPVLLVSLVRLPWLMTRSPGERLLRVLAFCFFAGSTTIVGLVAAYVVVLLHWNIVAYVAIGLIGSWLLASEWLFWPHVLIGLYLATAAAWNYSVAPSSLPGFVDQGTAANFGWPEVGVAVLKAERDHPDAFLAATMYNYAAQLSFQLHRLDVTAINPQRSQYDFWWNAVAHAGQDAIIVADAVNQIDLSSPRFASVTKLADVPVVRQGKQVWTFGIYLGQGYDGKERAAP
jgi:4-amino-4-deoxy-L-arabinose transferase-like glycosyltransferase